MAVTSIEWTATKLSDGTVMPGFTMNPWRGCSKISAGCEHCYAATMSKRNPGTLGVWGQSGTRVVASESMWRDPLKWDRKAKEIGVRLRVFCASLADVFEDWTGECQDSDGCDHYTSDTDPNVMVRNGALKGASPDGLHYTTLTDVRRRLYETINATPNLDWLLLSKRPENFRRMLPDRWLDISWPKNVWLGVSVENQEQADKRIPLLLQVPAAVRFLSCEPLLGPVDLSEWMYTLKVEHNGDGDTEEVPCRPDIHWVIVGGESGPNARPIRPQWARDLRDQCHAAGVPFFMKQWGEFAPCTAIDTLSGNTKTVCFSPEINPTFMARVGKKAAGRVLDGRTWDEFPEVHHG